MIQFPWRGIGAYVAKFDIVLMFGCATFSGTDLDTHSMALSFLNHTASLHGLSR